MGQLVGEVSTAGARTADWDVRSQSPSAGDGRPGGGEPLRWEGVDLRSCWDARMASRVPGWEVPLHPVLRGVQEMLAEGHGTRDPRPPGAWEPLPRMDVGCGPEWCGRNESSCAVLWFLLL